MCVGRAQCHRDLVTRPIPIAVGLEAQLDRLVLGIDPNDDVVHDDIARRREPDRPDGDAGQVAVAEETLDARAGRDDHVGDARAAHGEQRAAVRVGLAVARTDGHRVSLVQLGCHLSRRRSTDVALLEVWEFGCGRRWRRRVRGPGIQLNGAALLIGDAQGDLGAGAGVSVVERHLQLEGAICCRRGGERTDTFDLALVVVRRDRPLLDEVVARPVLHGLPGDAVDRGCDRPTRECLAARVLDPAVNQLRLGGGKVDVADRSGHPQRPGVEHRIRLQPGGRRKDGEALVGVALAFLRRDRRSVQHPELDRVRGRVRLEGERRSSARPKLDRLLSGRLEGRTFEPKLESRYGRAIEERGRDGSADRFTLKVGVTRCFQVQAERWLPDLGHADRRLRDRLVADEQRDAVLARRKVLDRKIADDRPARRRRDRAACDGRRVRIPAGQQPKLDILGHAAIRPGPQVAPGVDRVVAAVTEPIGAEEHPPGFGPRMRPEEPGPIGAECRDRF